MNVVFILQLAILGELKILVEKSWKGYNLQRHNSWSTYMLNHAVLQVNVCNHHNILVSKRPEYSLVISIFRRIDYLMISSGTISRIFSSRESM